MINARELNNQGSLPSAERLRVHPERLCAMSLDARAFSGFEAQFFRVVPEHLPTSTGLARARALATICLSRRLEAAIDNVFCYLFHAQPFLGV